MISILVLKCLLLFTSSRSSDGKPNQTAVFDSGASWSSNSINGQAINLVQNVPTNVDPALAALIQAQTGGNNSPYNWNSASLLNSLGGVASEVKAPTNVYSASNPYTPSNPCISAECIPVGKPGAGPDYISLQGNFYIASGGIAVNLHDGSMYGQWALGKSYPFGYKPGATLTAGNIIGGADASATSQFLQGASASAGGFYPLPVFPILGIGGGVNHSYGGATSTEVGLSFPPGPGGGVSPVGYGFDLNKKKE